MYEVVSMAEDRQQAGPPRDMVRSFFKRCVFFFLLPFNQANLYFHLFTTVFKKLFLFPSIRVPPQKIGPRSKQVCLCRTILLLILQLLLLLLIMIMIIMILISPILLLLLLLLIIMILIIMVMIPDPGQAKKLPRSSSWFSERSQNVLRTMVCYFTFFYAQSPYSDSGFQRV